MSILDDFKSQAKAVPMKVWLALGLGTVVLALYANSRKSKTAEVVAVPNLGSIDSYGKVSESERASEINNLTNKLSQQFKDQRESELGAIKEGYNTSLTEYQKSYDEKLSALENAWKQKEQSLLDQLSKRPTYSNSSYSYDYSPPQEYHNYTPTESSTPAKDLSHSGSTGNKYNDITNYQQTERDRVLSGYYDNKENRQFLHGDELRNYEYAKATGDYSHYKPTGVESWN